MSMVLFGIKLLASSQNFEKEVGLDFNEVKQSTGDVWSLRPGLKRDC